MKRMKMIPLMLLVSASLAFGQGKTFEVATVRLAPALNPAQIAAGGKVHIGMSIDKAPPGAAGPAGLAGAASDPGGSSIFDSVQKLGLKLEPRKVPVEMIVIDKIEKTPTEN